MKRVEANQRAQRPAAIPARLSAPAQDVVNYVFRTQQDGQIRCIISLDGWLDAGRMARAVRLSLDAEPVLSCRFVERSWRPYWERRNDLDRLSLCDVVVLPDPFAPGSDLWRFIAAPMDIQSDPLVQTRIFRAETDTLCIKIAHTAADGVGAIQYATRLAHIYRELCADPDYRPPPNLSSRGQLQVLQRLGPLAVLDAARHLSAGQATWSFPSMRSDGAGQDAALFAMRRVGPERLRAVKAYGRQWGATVNDVLMAALYRSLFTMVNPAIGAPCLITMPINLRRYLPDGNALPVCNLSSVIQFDLTRERDGTFDETLVRVHAAMQAAKSSYAGIGTALLWELLLLPGFVAAEFVLNRVLARVRASGATSLFFSNVGVIDAVQVDFGEVQVADAFGLGIVPFPPALSLVASTFRDTLTLTLGYCDTAFDTRTVERFLDLFVGELSQLERIQKGVCQNERPS